MIARASRADDGDETIFDVLAERARSHSARFLTGQVAVALACAALLLVIADARVWWPVAALFGGVAAYSAWGLVDAAERAAALASGAAPGIAGPRTRIVKLALAATATIATVLAVVGIALVTFVGDAPGPYGACTDDAGRTFACDAHGRRR